MSGKVIRRALVMGILFAGGTGEWVLGADDPRRFEAEIRSFQRRDQTNPPPAGPVLFTGSSSIVKWQTLARDLPGCYVLNRGFGGSTWRDLNYYFARVIPPYRPRALVVYEGDNDLAAGRSVNECLADFEEFRSHVHDSLRGIPVAILSVKASPSRQALQSRQEELNAAIRERLAEEPNWTVLDVSAPVLGPDRRPRPELFEADRLHLIAAGYVAWAPVVRPWVEKFGGP
jgi:lysophospholipase L1-like esterase